MSYFNVYGESVCNENINSCEIKNHFIYIYSNNGIMKKQLYISIVEDQYSPNTLRIVVCI